MCISIQKKSARSPPKIGTHDGWVERIKEIPETKIVKHGTPFTDYQIGRFKVIAEFNFKVLEEKNAMSGAPDFGHQLNYPIKSVYKPDCLKQGPVEGKDFKLWTSSQASKAVNRPISDEALIWSDQLDTKENQVVAREFLEKFMKHNKDFDILLKAELDVAPPNTDNIYSTELGIPKGEWYQSINNTLQDWKQVGHQEEVH